MTGRLGILHSWRRVLLLLPLTLVIVGLIVGFFNEALGPNLYLPFSFIFCFPQSRSSNPDAHTFIECVPPPLSDRPPTVNAFELLPDLLRQLWAPLLVPLTEPAFTTRDGTIKKLPADKPLIHTHPLGKRICILDVDTRELDEKGDIFASTLPKFSNIKLQTSGYVSHYLYAMIHGYTYKFLRVPTYKDRAPHWTKVIFTKELLKEYDIVVMLDYDAMFPSPELPFEWLLNYWQIDRDVIVAMSEDPNVGQNMDRKGKPNVNSGFIIAQSMGDPQRTQELFKDWAECPDEKRYKGCAKYKDVIFHEQSGFSSFVRYDFLNGLSVETEEGRKYVRALPCSEANGIPDVKDTGCIGHLVRHFWGHKFATPRELSESILENLVPLLAKAAFGDMDIVRDYRGMVLEGDGGTVDMFTTNGSMMGTDE
ncbi:hypothetical protein V8F33_012228 [Rhypophila sp. PSN 637]